MCLDPKIVHRFGDIICSWMLRRQYIALDDDEKQWVELGFARFRDPKDTSSERVLVDEPLIILAATHHLNMHTTVGLSDHVLNGLGCAAGRGTKFEEFIAVYLVQAFGSNVCMCDVFDFGADIPMWAESRGVELVVLGAEGEYRTVNHSSNRLVGPSGTLSCNLTRAMETVKWFQRPYTAMCFPDIHFGPDITFFIRLSDGRILCVILQVKFRSRPCLSKGEQDDSVSTLIHSQFYSNKVSTLQIWRGLSCLSPFLIAPYWPNLGLLPR